jgi:hypothetical protein
MHPYSLILLYRYMVGGMDPFDLDQLKLPVGAVGKPKSSNRLPRHKAGERFLRGPIPWRWLETAGRLPGKALHVAIALWLLASIKKTRTIRWEPSTAEAWHLNYQAFYRGLAALEGAGLVSVQRHRGRCPIVSIEAAR